MKACGSQIDAGMQVDIHRIAAEGAQEETGGSDRQSLTRTLQRNSAGQGLRHQHRNIGKSVDGNDRLAELADHRRFIVAAALAEMRFNSRCASICGSGGGIGLVPQPQDSRTNTTTAPSAALRNVSSQSHRPGHRSFRRCVALPIPAAATG
jgi:hypothetical protein